MPEVGVLTIRVEANTGQVEKDVDRMNTKLDKTQLKAARAQKTAARFATLSSALGATATGMGIHRAITGRSAVGGAAKTGAAAILRRMLFSPAGLLAAGGLAAYGVSKIIRGRRGGGSSAGRESGGRSEGVQILASMLQQTILQNKSLTRIQAEQMQANDPLARGLVFQTQRMRKLGLAPEAQAINVSTRKQEALGLLADAKAANRLNKQGGVFAEMGIGITNLRTQWELLKSRVGKARRSFFGVMDLGAPQPAGGGQLAAFKSLFSSAANIIRRPAYLMSGGRIGESRPFMQSGFFAPASRDTESMLTTAQRQQRERFDRQVALAGLFRRGPGDVLTPAPTVRAGDESEYAFRVQQQRRGLQQEAEREWQGQVRELLGHMVRLGEATEEQMVQFNINIGRLGGAVP